MKLKQVRPGRAAPSASCLPGWLIASGCRLLFVAAVVVGAVHVTAAPQLKTSAFKLDFSREAVGKATPLVLFVTNAGNAPLTLKEFKTVNPVFTLVPPVPLEAIEAGAARTITVGFAPVAVGPADGSLTFASDDPLRPNVAITLAGEGVAPLDCFTVPAGLVAWWAGEGNADDVLKGHPATATHGTGYADGRVGRAFQLDGLANYVEVADHADWNFAARPFTIELWVKFAGPGVDAALVSHHNGALGWSFGTHNGALGLSIDGPNGTVEVATTPLGLKAGAWLHLAVTRGANTARFYVNGVVAGQGDLAGELPSVASALTLGQGGGARFLNGLLDEVSVYGRELSGVEVGAIFQAGAAGKCAGAVVLPEPVRLRIERDPAGIGLFWPGPDFALEAAGDLGAATPWQPVVEPPVPSGAEVRVKQAAPEGRRFFRLRGPAGNSGPAVTGQPTLTGISSVRQLIPAATGGTLVSDDGRLRLAIPAGALAADREIAVTNFVFNAAPGGQEVHEIVFAPAGLTLLQPARLTVKFSEAESVRDPLVFWLSDENPPLALGSEISQWHQVAAPATDGAARTVSIPVEHFSLGSIIGAIPNTAAQAVGGAANFVFFADRVYLVFELDGKYLKKGDLLYALSKAEIGSGHTWFPGHTGLYLGNTNAGINFNNGVTVIEATPEDGPLKQTDGVQYGELGKFKTLVGNHIFMGARRPLFPLTEAERTTIASWAISKLGVPYSKIGGPFLTSGRPFAAGLSCVGLTEGAYEAAGKSIVPGLLEPVLWPLRQFAYTKPVDEVSLVVGDKFLMYLNGVVRSGLNYGADPSLYQVSVEAEAGSPANRALLAGRAQLLTAGNNRFQFSPADEDAELTLIFKFTVTPNDPGFAPVQRKLFVHVRPLDRALVRQDVLFQPQSGLRDPLNLDGLQTATTTTVVVTNRQATISLTWAEPPAGLAADGQFDFPVTASYTPTGIATFGNRFLSTQLTAFYWDTTGIVSKQVLGNVAFTGHNTHQKPEVISTNSTIKATITEPGRTFRLSTVWLRLNSGVNGTGGLHAVYDLFWDYKPVP